MFWGMGLFANNTCSKSNPSNPRSPLGTVLASRPKELSEIRRKTNVVGYPMNDARIYKLAVFNAGWCYTYPSEKYESQLG